MAKNLNLSETFNQYLGVAAGGNIRVCADMGKGVHLRCKLCSGVYILKENAMMDYVNVGILEEKVQEFVTFHRHKEKLVLLEKPKQAKPILKMETGKLYEWNQDKQGGYIDFPETPKKMDPSWRNNWPGESSTKQAPPPREIKTEGRKFRCDD